MYVLIEEALGAWVNFSSVGVAATCRSASVPVTPLSTASPPKQRELQNHLLKEHHRLVKRVLLRQLFWLARSLLCFAIKVGLKSCQHYYLPSLWSGEISEVVLSLQKATSRQKSHTLWSHDAHILWPSMLPRKEGFVLTPSSDARRRKLTSFKDITWCTIGLLNICYSLIEIIKDLHCLLSCSLFLQISHTSTHFHTKFTI